MALNLEDPFVTNMEDEPSPEGLEPEQEELPLEDSDDTTLEASAESEEPEETEPEPEATHAPVVDDEIQKKLTRLEQIERDHEISQIIQQREAAARQAEMEQARAAAERRQVDDYFAKQRSDIVTMFNANQLSPEQFVTALDNLAAARVEVSNRQMQQQVAEYVQYAIDGKLGNIASGYKERQAFHGYAPEIVQADPRVGDVIETWRMKYGIPQEEISLLIEAGRKAYKASVKQSNTEAAQSARRAGAVEPPTRVSRTRRSEADEDKEIRSLAKEFFQ